MKKLFALLTVVLFAGFMMAQNTSSVNQSGSGNDADVDQTGNINGSTIIQNTWGTGHIAEVTQNGASNKSDLFQDQRGASAFIEQLGTSNTSGLKQSGPNDANVYQNGEGNVLGSYSNFLGQAFQKNGTSFADDDNILDLDQIGDFNKAGVWQEHHATAILYQDGNLNESKIYQSGAPSGIYNSATVEIYVDLNTTNQSQIGDANQSTVKIGLVAPLYLSDENTVDVEQLGNSNVASFGLQMGDDNDVDIEQNGNTNYTELFVNYGDENELTETVEGNSNRTRFSIAAPWLNKSSENTLDINKDGNTNYVSGSIQGDGNDVVITQDGDNNRVGTSWYTGDGVNIMGDVNTVDISQTGNSNMSLNTVSGNGNNIVVNQSN